MTTLNKTLLSKLKREATIIIVGSEIITFTGDNYAAYVVKQAALQIDPFIIDPNSKFNRRFVGIVESNDLDAALSDQGRSIKFDAKRLAALAACASTDEARPILASVEFDGSNAVATDSYKLLTYKFEGLNGRYSAKALSFAAKSFKRSGEVHGEVMADNSLAFYDMNIRVILKDLRSQGDYPNWSALFPTPVNPVKVNLGDLPKFSNPYGSNSQRHLVILDSRAYVYGFGDGSGGAIIGELPGHWPIVDDSEHVQTINLDHFSKAVAAFDGSFTYDTAGVLKPIVLTNGDVRAMVMPIRTDKLVGYSRELVNAFFAKVAA